MTGVFWRPVFVVSGRPAGGARARACVVGFYLGHASSPSGVGGWLAGGRRVQTSVEVNRRMTDVEPVVRAIVTVFSLIFFLQYYLENDSHVFRVFSLTLIGDTAHPSTRS
jgi:UPF0288 family protein (methanogenesis marker protein 3)